MKPSLPIKSPKTGEPENQKYFRQVAALPQANTMKSHPNSRGKGQKVGKPEFHPCPTVTRCPSSSPSLGWYQKRPPSLESGLSPQSSRQEASGEAELETKNFHHHPVVMKPRYHCSVSEGHMSSSNEASLPTGCSSQVGNLNIYFHLAGIRWHPLCSTGRVSEEVC